MLKIQTRKFIFPTYQMVSAGRSGKGHVIKGGKKHKRGMSAPFVFSFPRKSYGQLSLGSSFDPFSRFVNTHSMIATQEFRDVLLFKMITQ